MQETNLSIEKVIAPRPGTVCEECVANHRKDLGSGFLIWCEHSNFGANYDIEQRMWRIYGPFEDFDAWHRWIFPAGHAFSVE